MPTLPRLSDKEMNVIEQLIKAPAYGLQLVARSKGVLTKTAIYVILGRMVNKRLVRGVEEPTPPGETGPPRRVYTVTVHGAQLLAAYKAAMALLRN